MLSEMFLDLREMPTMLVRKLQGLMHRRVPQRTGDPSYAEGAAAESGAETCLE